MILPDTNVLIYATFESFPEHRRTKTWLEARLGEEAVVACWPVLFSYARLASDRRVFGAGALSVSTAWDVVAAFLEQAVRVVSPGPGHAAIARELIATPGLGSADVPDVQIAALAIEHGLALATHDSGFRRFTALRVLDPLLAG